MLSTVDHKSRSAKSITPATFGELAVRERFDLQEWVLACPQLLGDELLIVTAEFDQFDRTSERLDVLAVDRRGKLVVVELKRTAVGTKADLQALRYAAYCSTLAIDDVADLFAVYRHQRRLSDSQDSTDAKRQILEFIEEPEFEEFDDKPRIILAAEEFPPEMTATLLWLRSFDVDISAVRLQPYRVGESLLVDCSVLIPLPEAKDFVVRREKKEVRQAMRERGKGKAYLPWFQALVDELREAHQFTNARVAQPQNWYSFRSGLTRISYSVVFAQQGLRAEIYIDPSEQDENKRIFDNLHAKQAEIEQEYGSALSWERLDSRRACRVGIYRDTTIDASPDDLDEAREWAIQQLLLLKKVFETRLRQLLR